MGVKKQGYVEYINTRMQLEETLNSLVTQAAIPSLLNRPRCFQVHAIVRASRVLRGAESRITFLTHK